MSPLSGAILSLLIRDALAVCGCAAVVSWNPTQRRIVCDLTSTSHNRPRLLLAAINKGCNNAIVALLLLHKKRRRVSIKFNQAPLSQPALYNKILNLQLPKLNSILSLGALCGYESERVSTFGWSRLSRYLAAPRAKVSPRGERWFWCNLMDYTGIIDYN